MTDATQAYEKLGSFYMGRVLDDDGNETPEPVLYDSKDLTTHAVIIGMTGSGKTGLGIGLIEEAAIDNIPVIAIDPKGDMGNMLLTFPEMRGSDLEPWVDPQTAANKGLTTTQFADKQAKLWKSGLESWNQPLERVQKLKDSAEFNIYTPGSSAGIPVSVLQTFSAPPQAVRDDYDTYSQKIQATATSVLTLLSIDADPLTSQEHILLSNIFQATWDKGESLDIAGLIGAIQSPPMERIGVMDLESFYPSKKRFALAMRINGLLASPGFAAWMQGVPLDARQLFYTENGKPRVSVMSIAHLDDSERMFFVTMLLAEIISWMRAQPGTGSLRAILYMDEIFGYMPPTANPPSKQLLLLLLKQARAFGLGVVLSTQNPVDLDYKGLSNTGTWFIGRLQTERDKMRVLEGLEGATAGGKFDKAGMERTLAGLGKRKFLLHNVHDSGPADIFSTRWVLSYLAGPLTRNQIKTLMADKANSAASKPAIAKPAAKTQAASTANRKPALAPEITQLFARPTLDATEPDSTLVYKPTLLGAAEVLYSNRTHKVEEELELCLGLDIDANAVGSDWEDAEPLPLELSDLRKRGQAGAQYLAPAPVMEKKTSYSKWEKALKRHIRTDRELKLLRCTELKISSAAGEREGDFRIRLQTAANEERDIDAGKLRKKYDSKITTLENRIRRAEQAIDTQEAQKRQKQLDTAASVGTAIFSAFFGGGRRRRVSASRASTTMRRANAIRKESQDVRAAEDNLEALQVQMADLQQEFQLELDSLSSKFDAQNVKLEEVVIRASSTNIHIPAVGLLWMPYWKDVDGFMEPAFEIES